MPKTTGPADGSPRVAKRVALAIAAILVYCAFAFVNIEAFELNNPESGIISSHFPTIIGLPLAAALAFIVVLLLPASYGQIEFKALSVSLKGASGPICSG